MPFVLFHILDASSQVTQSVNYYVYQIKVLIRCVCIYKSLLMQLPNYYSKIHLAHHWPLQAKITTDQSFGVKI